ncbi:hypothetical protein H2203_002754 [Taxawa tesnikishii (nom. ined.)]|nr:hypothetical protein H2203_002754 [Dothideales sp. JES 119]
MSNYYHARPLDPVREHAHLRDQAVQAAIVELLPLPPAHINKLLIDTTTRIATVRFCIAWTIFAGLGIDSDAESTFLPPELVQCAQALSSSGNTQTGKAAKSQGQAYNIDADDTADGPISFQTWRAITATLGKHTYGQLSDESDDARSANIHHAVESLNTILRPFADLRHNDRARLDNLAELLRRAARFGFMLFSQPSLWEFDWGLEREMRQDRLVVFPALVQIDESGGNASARSRKLTEREVCGLEGR